MTITGTITESPTSRTDLLRNIIIADAIVTGSAATLLALAASPLGSVLGLPATLLRFAGVGLIPYAAFLLWVGLRKASSLALVRLLVTANLLWVVGSVALLFSSRIDPTALGVTFILIQAAMVAAFATLQHLNIRSLPHPTISRKTRR